MEITPTLPNYQTRNSWWHPNFSSYNCNMCFVKNQKNTIPHVRRHTQPSQLLITQFRLNTHKLSRVLQHQKQTQYSMLQIKTYFEKHLSTFDILLLPPPFISHNLARGLTMISEETTQRKHTYVTPSSSLTNNWTSPTKIIQAKNPVQADGWILVS